MQNWAAYLQYLSSILVEFDPEYAPKKDTMIWYFWNCQKLLVSAKIEQRGQEFDSFKEIFENTVDVEAKAARRPHSSSRESNQHCFWDSQLVIANASTQGQSMKDARVDKSKARSLESKGPVFQRLEDEKNSEKARKRKEKRERYQKDRWSQNSTLVTLVNATNPSKGPSNERVHKNLTHVTNYNFDKKSHY